MHIWSNVIEWVWFIIGDLLFLFLTQKPNLSHPILNLFTNPLSLITMTHDVMVRSQQHSLLNGRMYTSAVYKLCRVYGRGITVLMGR